VIFGSALWLGAAWRSAERERERAEQHAAEANRQRDLEARSFRWARDAVKRMQEVASDELDVVPGAQKVQEDLLKAALEYYEEFLRRPEADAALDLDFAFAGFNAANIHASLGERQKAISTYERARAILEEYLERHPEDASARNLYAMTCHNLSRILHATDPSTAVRLLRIAINVREKQLEALNKKEEKPSAKFLTDLAGSYRALGTTEFIKGDSASGFRYYRQALDILDPLYEPGMVRTETFLVTYAEALSGFAARKRVEGDLGEARRYLDRAEQVAALLKKYHGRPGRIAVTASTLIAQGIVSHEQGETAAAQGRFMEASNLLKGLVESNPTVPEYRDLLGRCYRHLGTHHERLSNIKEALAYHREAVRVLSRLSAEYPSSHDFQESLAYSQYYLGSLLRMTRQFDEAREKLDEARERAENLLRRFPKNGEYQGKLGSMYYTLGLVEYERQADLSSLPPETRKWYTKAREILERAVQSPSVEPDVRVALGATLNNLSGDRKPGDPERRRLQREAIRQLDLAHQARPADLEWRELLAICRANAAIDMVRSDIKLLPEAVAEAEKSWQLQVSHPKCLVDLALIFSAFAYPEEADAARSPEDERRQQTAAETAMKALTKAVDTIRKQPNPGLVETIKTSPALDPLRGRKDFKDLLQRLSEKPPPRPQQ
jgi:tetratricopeptide (TPR) repeat protein